MTLRFLKSIALATALVAVSGCSQQAEEADSSEAAADPYAGLAITDATAKALANAPIGSVPGMVTLPPEARVAVTPTFPGSAVRVYVVEGQAVRRGQALALIRAAEPVQIRGELERARSEVGLASARASRLNQLAGEGIIAKARADEAQAQLQQARASLAQQQRLAALSGAGADGTMTLSAPISGRVSHVGVETGGPVDGMSAPFVVEAVGSYQIELQLPERLASQVRVGMPVEVSLASDAGAEPVVVGGQILTVSPSIDPATRSVLARASIGAAPGISAGRNVSVTIKGSGNLDGVAVPEAAVTTIGDATYVFIKKGKAYENRPVTLVSQGGGQAIVSEGLKVGETVAASSIAELKAMAAE